MRTIHEPSRELPVVAEVDLVVVGGGPAGVAAAIAAARAGARTMLVERYGCLGGLATGGLVLYMDGLFDATGRRCVAGVFWETIERLEEMGGVAREDVRRLHADSELLKLVLDDMCDEAGVILRFHSWAVSVLMDDTTVTGVVLESKSGRQAVLSSVCVDATGDGDLAALAGAGYETGRQCIGLNYKIGGVNASAFRRFAGQRRDDLAGIDRGLRNDGGFPIRLGRTPYSDDGVYWVNVLGLAAVPSGEPSAAEVGDEMPADDGEAVLRHFAGRLDATRTEDLSAAEVFLRRRIVLSIDRYRLEVPGFADARLLAFASQLGVRDSRRVRGLTQVTRDSVLAAAAVTDSVGAAALPFRPKSAYAVPYGCLVPQDRDGLLVSGRCVWCDSWAQQALRLIPAAFVTGEAAGTAASLCVRHGTPPRSLDSTVLRSTLEAQGATV
jgi:hypothetical protein